MNHDRLSLILAALVMWGAFPLLRPQASVAQTPTPTPLGPGPRILYFRPINSDGCEFCCSLDCTRTPTPTPQADSLGRPIYARSSGRPLLVVEARRGPANRIPGSILIPSLSTQRPDLQMLFDRNLGDGSIVVCDTGPSGGGVPAIVPPDFRADQYVTNALVDVSCRFSVQTSSFPCTKSKFGDFAFMNPLTERQYCFQVPLTVEFPAGDTVVALQLRDTSGNLGERKEIVVRVGSVAPETFSIAGRVHYYRDDRPVPAASIQLTGAASASTTTSSTGNYSFGALTGANWQVQPLKTGDFDAGISSLDAAYVLQKLALTRAFDSFQNLACDVTGDGTISSLDASAILQFAVGKTARFPVAATCGSDWVFVPSPAPVASPTPIMPVISSGSCQRGAIQYNPLSANATGQDFNGVLFGDCTGNWQPPGGGGGGLAVEPTSAAEAWVRTPRRVRGRRVRLAIGVQSSTPFHAVDAQLAYDPSLLRPLVVRKASSIRGATLRHAVGADGLVKLALARASPMQPGAQPLVRVAFEILGRFRGSLPVRLKSVAVDELPVRLGSRSLDRARYR